MGGRGVSYRQQSVKKGPIEHWPSVNHQKERGGGGVLSIQQSVMRVSSRCYRVTIKFLRPRLPLFFLVSYNGPNQSPKFELLYLSVPNGVSCFSEVSSRCYAVTCFEGDTDTLGAAVCRELLLHFWLRSLFWPKTYWKYQIVGSAYGLCIVRENPLPLIIIIVLTNWVLQTYRTA